MDTLEAQLQQVLRERGGHDAARSWLNRFSDGQWREDEAVAAQDAESIIQQTELLYMMLEQREATEQAAESDREPRRGTVQWYRQHKDDPVAPGARISIFQAAYCLLRFKQQGTVPDLAFAGLMRFLTSGGLMDDGNVMPKCALLIPHCVCMIRCADWRCRRRWARALTSSTGCFEVCIYMHSGAGTTYQWYMNV